MSRRKAKSFRTALLAAELEDRTVSIVTIVIENPRDGRLIDDTDEALQVELRRAALPSRPVRWSRITPLQVPADRTFRGAWAVSQHGTIEVDMTKARDIHRERLRALRAPALQALDVAYMRADEAGDASAKLRIGQRKERLRQVTEHPEIEAAQSPEELAVAGLSAMVVD